LNVDLDSMNQKHDLQSGQKIVLCWSLSKNRIKTC